VSAAFGPILRRAAAGARVTADDAKTLIRIPDEGLADLLGAAAAVRDRGKGRTVTYSRKVFIPLTNYCRDYCRYCTYRKDFGDPGGWFLEPDEVLRVVRAGARLGCKEALFSLGDKPEAAFPALRDVLRRLGYRTTLEYLAAVCAAVVRETPLFPHANPGLMGRADLRRLKASNVSVGIMLESVSDRLLQPGGPHDDAPDKVPALRLKTIEAAGQLRMAFTTGILIGIGETPGERVDALAAIGVLHARHGHIQEVIVQNFRAKPDIPMRDADEPAAADMARTIAVARLLLGPAMNVQAPPNLTPEEYRIYLRAGINDWGGVSPLTLDYINPEMPWPKLAELHAVTAAEGFTLRERLALYPEFIGREGFLAPALAEKVRAAVDADGYPRTDSPHAAAPAGAGAAGPRIWNALALQ
jgi:FO synthase